MIYTLNDLLVKMGAPDVVEKNTIEWHYCDRESGNVAGFAHIRLEAGGERLIAELKQLHENFEDDDGKVHAHFEESFYFYAERAARPDHYRVTRIAFDGDDYSNPSKAITELALSVFHSRALDISIRMVEQIFNKQDIVEPSQKERIPFAGFAARRAEGLKSSFGTVIPFPVRKRA